MTLQYDTYFIYNHNMERCDYSLATCVISTSCQVTSPCLVSSLFVLVRKHLHFALETILFTEIQDRISGIPCNEMGKGGKMSWYEPKVPDLLDIYLEILRLFQ